MRRCLIVILLAALPVLAKGEQGLPSPYKAQVETFSNQGKVGADREFREARKLLVLSRTREALEHLETAVRMSPDNMEYRAASNMARQKLVQEDIRQGTRAVTSGNRVEAIGSFQEALELDPQNEFALQQLRGTLMPSALPSDTRGPEMLPEVHIKPALATHTFHITGNYRDVIAQVCQTYGIRAVLDESVRSAPIRLDLDNASWSTAMMAVTRMTRTFWTPLSNHQVWFAADTEANRNALIRSIQRTFYFSDSVTPQTLNDIVTAMRTLFEVKAITTDLSVNSISVRAGPETMAAVSHLLRGLKDRQQQVLLDIRIFQVSSSFTRSFGVTVPTEFQVFYIPTASAAALITQTVLQQGSTTLNNLALGTKQLALSLPSASVTASQSQSNIRTIDELTLRASQGEAAVFKVGERYPILTSSYSPVVSNQSFQVPIPAFTYMDIGLNLKATPSVHRDGTVGIQLQLQLSGLGPQSSNGDPVIFNSEFNGYVSAQDGEPIVAAGNIMKSTSNTRSGWAGVSLIPGLGSIFSSPTKQVNDDDLLIVIIPHIISPSGEGKQGSFLFGTI